MGDLVLTVASWDDRDDLVVELTVEHGNEVEDLGLVTYDANIGKAIIDIYPRQSGEDWRFDLDEVCAILARAQRRIMEVAGPLPNEEPPSAAASEPVAAGMPPGNAVDA